MQKRRVNQNYLELPSFIEDESTLNDWELDRYLIDKKNVYKILFNLNGEIAILDLFHKSKSSINNFGRLLSELKDNDLIKIINENLIEISATARLKIFSNSNQIFYSKLKKSWETIPSDIKPLKSKKKSITKLPKSYKKLNNNQ